MSASTVARICRAAGLSRLRHLGAPAVPVVRYERKTAGVLLHVDIKRLGRFDRVQEWAYRFSYDTSAERNPWLTPYLHFYNYRQKRSMIG